MPPQPRDVKCRQCGEPRYWREFLDEHGELSTRCKSCREEVATGRQTPQAKRRASGMISRVQVEELRKLEAEEADTLPPPAPSPEQGDEDRPDDDPDSEGH